MGDGVSIEQVLLSTKSCTPSVLSTNTRDMTEINTLMCHITLNLELLPMSIVIHIQKKDWTPLDYLTILVLLCTILQVDVMEWDLSENSVEFILDRGMLYQ